MDQQLVPEVRSDTFRYDLIFVFQDLSPLSNVDKITFLIESIFEKGKVNNASLQSDWEFLSIEATKHFSDPELSKIANAITDNHSLNHYFIKECLKTSCFASSFSLVLIKAYAIHSEGKEFLHDLIEDEKTNVNVLAQLVFLKEEVGLEENDIMYSSLRAIAGRKIRSLIEYECQSLIVWTTDMLSVFYEFNNSKINESLDLLIVNSFESITIDQKLILISGLVIVAQNIDRLWKPISKLLFNLCFEDLTESQSESFCNLCQCALEHDQEQYFLGKLNIFLADYGLEKCGLVYSNKKSQYHEQGEWFDTNTYLECVNLIPCHLAVISDLEKARKGASAYLNQHFGIRMFGRYDVNALIDLYDFEIDTSIDKLKNRNILIVMTTVYDNEYESFTNSYAILELYQQTREISPKPVVVYYEFNSRRELIKNLLSIGKYQQNSLFLQINAHGDSNGITISNNEILDTCNILNNELIINGIVKSINLERLYLTLNSCSVARSRLSFITFLGCALKSSEIDFELTAPNANTPLTQYIFCKDAEGNLNIVVSFNFSTIMLSNDKKGGYRVL